MTRDDMRMVPRTSRSLRTRSLRDTGRDDQQPNGERAHQEPHRTPARDRARPTVAIVLAPRTTLVARRRVPTPQHPVLLEKAHTRLPPCVEAILPEPQCSDYRT